MQQRKQDFDKLGVTIVAVGEMDRESMVKWLEEKKLTASGIRFVCDSAKGAVVRAYSVDAIPANFFIDATGTVFASEIGFGSSADPLLAKFK